MVSIQRNYISLRLVILTDGFLNSFLSYLFLIAFSAFWVISPRLSMYLRKGSPILSLLVIALS